MKIYKMTISTKGQGFLAIDEVEKWWSIRADETAQIVKTKAECDQYGVLYAVEYDTEDMPMDKLLKILHKKLPSREVEEICKQNQWLGERYSEYLQNF